MSYIHVWKKKEFLALKNLIKVNSGKTLTINVLNGGALTISGHASVSNNTSQESLILNAGALNLTGNITFKNANSRVD